MDEFVVELRELDDTQERVESVSEQMLKAAEEKDVERQKEMVSLWIQELRASDFLSERIAFLYVANHVLQKTSIDDDSLLLRFFQDHLEEAISLVSNSPTDRQSVAQLLQLWHKKELFPSQVILKLWECTGEDLPEFLADALDDAAAAKDTASSSDAAASGDAHVAEDGEPGSSAPMKLNAHSAFPVLDFLKQIDRHRAVVGFLTKKLTELQKKEPLLDQLLTTEDILASHCASAAQTKQRVEECLRLSVIRHKYMQQVDSLRQQLKGAVERMIVAEEAASSKTEQKFEQCDLIDIGLADLAEHRDNFAEEWGREAQNCHERRKRLEEEQRQREEEIARRHQEAIAESAAHALDLEASITSAEDLQYLSKSIGREPKEKETKPEDTNEMVWHPVLKELVPLQSLNLDMEDWRDNH